MGADPVGIRRLRQYQGRNLEACRSGHVNSRITTWSWRGTGAGDGVYRVVTATRNNGQGLPGETQKTLVSPLSSTLESKTVFIGPRGNISTQWANTEQAPCGRKKKSSIPTSMSRPRSSTTLLPRRRTTPGITSHARPEAYAETGIIYTLTRTDGATHHYDTYRHRRAHCFPLPTRRAARLLPPTTILKVDQPSAVTNALRKTTCYNYDLRGRNAAQ